MALRDLGNLTYYYPQDIDEEDAQSLGAELAWQLEAILRMKGLANPGTPYANPGTPYGFS